MEKTSRGFSMISFQPLRNLLSERKVSTYFLRNKCGQYNLDNKTIQRFMNDESISTQTVNSLCSIFKCDVSEIMEFTPDEKAGDRQDPDKESSGRE